MTTDRDLCALAAAAYTSAPTWRAGDVHAVCTGPVIALRGTVPDSMADWCRDFDALPVHDQVLGWCHQGFLDGARAILPAVLDSAQGRLTLVGHSLGGALALLLAGLLVGYGVPVVAVVAFGAPCAGGRGLAEPLERTQLRLYRHGADPVPFVPWLPGILEQPAALLHIGQCGSDPIEDHFVARYLAALEPVA